MYLIKQKILHRKILCFSRAVKNLQTSLKVSNTQNYVLCVLKQN
jgi:hypothetical protein